MRRCGKSTILEQYIRLLKQKSVADSDIIAMNFETFEGQKIKDAAMLNDWLEERVPADRQSYVFLDEIQNVERWEMSVAALCTIGTCDVYVTGSNSDMLSSDLATHISGRYVEIGILPLSLSEFSELNEGDANELFVRYVEDGGLPGINPDYDRKGADQYLEGVINTVVVKDVASRIGGGDVRMISSIARFLYSNIGNVTSVATIASNTGLSMPTVSRYVQAMVDAHLFYYAERYDIVGRKILKTKGKYYASDLGMRRVALGRGGDIGRSIENIVYLELIRRGYKVRIGSIRDAEIDFVASKGDVIEYYQVSQTLMSEETLQRELRSLRRAKDDYAKTIVTCDRFVWNDKGIRIVNIVDWLTSQSQRTNPTGLDDGAADGNRTHDLRLTKASLYPLATAAVAVLRNPAPYINITDWFSGSGYRGLNAVIGTTYTPSSRRYAC